MTIDLDTPEGFGQDVKTTIEGTVDLEQGVSRMEARSDDGDAWFEVLVDETVYRSRGEVEGSSDWCAVPVTDAGAFLQTGASFGQVPDLLRSAEAASALGPSGGREDSADEVTFPPQENALGEVVDDSATVWLDAKGRPTRIAFGLDLVIAGAPNPAMAQVEWMLSDWGEAEVDVQMPPSDEIATFPDCT